MPPGFRTMKSCRLLRVVFTSLVFCLTTAGLKSAEPPVVLRAGAAREDITPDVAVRNWVTGKPYGEVLDPLAVHALVLDDGRTKAVLVRWDLVDVSESARDEVRKRVGSALRIPADNILVHASHNHSGPWAPVYDGNSRGRERDTWWAIRYMPVQNEHPPFKAWMERLLAASETAAKRAADGARPVDIAIARVAISEYLYNRRPRQPTWGLADPKAAAPLAQNHPEWNPEVLYGGATFGPMDRTLSLVLFRQPDGSAVASLFHVACHAVSIYPSNPAISADWPGAASRTIAAALGGEALFLQGCTGDINPWRRGAAKVAEMAEGIAAKATLAAKHAAKLAPTPLQVARVSVDLPLMPAAKQRIGADTVAAEVQAIACGPLAFVAIPGEPMTEINTNIRERSPYPQTLVLGYSNGNGVHYVGMPGEKARGGYEVGVAGAGTDECGALLVDAAGKLLRDMFQKSGPARGKGGNADVR